MSLVEALLGLAASRRETEFPREAEAFKRGNVKPAR